MATKTHNTGVYEIRNVVNSKVYVGSAKRFDLRWNTHRSFLRKGKHHSPHLQAAWNKYGEQAFEFRKLRVCSPKDMIGYEQLVIDGFKSANRLHGYNARPTAESMLGYKHTPATRAKMVLAVTGRKASPETKALLSRQRTGRKMPEWFPAFTRAHKTGTKHSDATKAIISAKGVGRPCSLQTREKKAKLTFAQVNEIQARFAAGGITQSALAREYSLSQSAISLLVRGKRWGEFNLSKGELS